jgi:cytochrome c
MHFSKQLVATFFLALLLDGCGGSGENKPAAATDTTAASTSTAPASSGAANESNDKALELIGSSDCTTCHRLNQASSGSNIGPAYDQVAAKYSPAADTTVDRLIKKVISGGSGIWGTVPMTPHPQLQPTDVKIMVTYILSLKK